MDKVSQEKRSEIMSKVRNKNTKPELTVRSLAHRLGYRFRLHRKDLPGKPDLVFPKFKKVIFVHGCFWHGHDCKAGKNRPKSNIEFWEKKLSGNIERDKKNLKALSKLGWEPLIIWECETKNHAQLSNSIQQFLQPSHLDK